MASARTEYPAMLPNMQPAQAVDVLSDRVRQVTRLNTTVADWLLERRRLEEQYAAGLRRLARSQVDESDLGVFSVPWNSITNSMDALAEAHAGLATKVEVDIERPLREFSTSNREMQALSTMQGNLAALAKDVDKAQQKAEKLQVRGDRVDSSKVVSATSDLDNARSQWDSQAPYGFETLQALDETRVDQLRDALTQLLTLEADQVEKSRVATEQSLNVVLNVETADEIKTFAIKTVTNASKPSLTRPQRTSFAAAATPTRAATSSSNLATVPSNTEEEPSERATSVSESKKSGLKGLKRFGTVIGRRKDKDKDKESKQQMAMLPSTAESPEPDRSKRFTTFGRLGRSKESPSLEPTPEDGSSLQRPRSPQRVGSEIMESSESRQGLGLAPQLPALNGLPGHQEDLAGLEPPTANQSEDAQASIVESPRQNDNFSSAPANLDPISLAQAEAATIDDTGAEDSSAQHPYSVNIRNAPIQEEGADAALASMANKLQAPPLTTRRAGTVRGRRDARNSYVPPEQQISEITSPSQTTIEPIQSIPVAASTPALAPAPAPAPVPVSQTAFPTSTTIPAPSQPDIVSPGAISPPPAAIFAEPMRPASRTATGLDQLADDRSMRSGRSSSTAAGQAMRHPEMHENGLNSSIIETVVARFDNGKLSSSSLFGEIALVYNSANSSSTPVTPETIRLENFSILEKVAPNPAFVTQSVNKEGEYSVSLSGLSRTQIAFKYQLHADDTHAHVPLLIESAVKNEPNQTSVIVNYSLNPTFNLRGQSSIILNNVVLALSLEGGKASSCQSRPVGTFSRERNLVYWQIGDITLTQSASTERLLARFATDSEAHVGNIDCKWEISNEQAQNAGSGLAVSAAHQQSGAADPFADDEAGTSGMWRNIPSFKKIVSGSYVAKP